MTDKSLLENFEKEMKKSKTLRIAMKTCLNAASSTSVFLFSLIEAFFCDRDTKLFKNVKWSNVAKTEEFKKWVDNFLKESIEFRERQIEEFGKLTTTISKNLRDKMNFDENEMEDMSLAIIKKSTDPGKMVSVLRNMADVISHLEGVNDTFHSKKIERRMTNLQIRIDDLQSKNFF